MIKLYLFDIEGTTTDIHFVHKVLFPYSYEKMEQFINDHLTDESVKLALKSVQSTAYEEDKKTIGLTESIEQLKSWIKTDRKHPALKEIQGLIWADGYKKGEFKGHLYPDVKPFFENLLQKNCKIGIYSSGSVQAQKLIFGYSVEGDLTSMISYYFDTKVGHKREVTSYENIAKLTGLTPQEIHFFSDIKEELQAAHKAGFEVTQLLREGTQKSEFRGITGFDKFI